MSIFRQPLFCTIQSDLRPLYASHIDYLSRNYSSASVKFLPWFDCSPTWTISMPLHAKQPRQYQFCPYRSILRNERFTNAPKTSLLPRSWSKHLSILHKDCKRLIFILMQWRIHHSHTIHKYPILQHILHKLPKILF